MSKSLPIIEIDENSGFCAGVINAIRTAEECLRQSGTLYCLGDIVHNSEELQRLTQMGLHVITHDDLKRLRGVRVLIRAHGEPPETYAIAKQNGIEIIDATCKVVLHLQQTIKKCYEQHQPDGAQILIFGKKGHAEVVGLLGQSGQSGRVISNLEDLGKIDFSRPAWLFSQTTQNLEQYNAIIGEIRKRYAEIREPEHFHHSNTICQRVVNRARQIEEFATRYEAVIFVSGEKSSNGLYLFDICRKANFHSYFVSRLEQLADISLDSVTRIGICGATSTPMWLMEQVKETLLLKYQSNNINNL